MENLNTIIEIPVKGIILGEFENFDSWIKNVQDCANKHGVNSKLLHQDKNGFVTTGYDLKNHNGNNPYPVKTYLLVQNTTILEPEPFNATSNN
jgi:hypothetical protein